MKGGFILKCDQSSNVKEIMRDDLSIIEIGKSLTQVVDPYSLSKVLSFFKEIQSNGSALGWEINLKGQTDIQSLFMAGIYENDQYYIVGSTDADESRNFYNDLMSINNWQQNALREALKDNAQFKEKLNTNDSFNELTKINNEMVNLQRELTKKNQSLLDLNELLESKNRELDQFAHIVSHDLKAPLRGVCMLIDMIKEDYEKDFNPELSKLFELIRSRSRKMDDLINAILAYSKAGKVDTKITTFNLKELIDDLRDALAIPPGIKFIVPEVLPDLTCSYIQLSQVLNNLVSNAVKYYNKDIGVIKLVIKKAPDNYLKYSVIDEGPGIPEQYHAKIFNPFETANHQGNAHSTGIGLAIVQKLVKQHGGTYGLKSAVGLGSTFWFTWPKTVGKI